MYFMVEDFNDAGDHFDGRGSARWSEIEQVLMDLTPQMQASDQARKIGDPIFDPKATNAALTQAASLWRWSKIPVPPSLQPFGNDWDAGKGSVLAEWQFSNYPFLWNNIIRTEAIFQSQATLPGLQPIDALIIVTKSGTFPASNSTLYFEQALAQIDTVTALGVFTVPIRLVGLTIPPGATTMECDWNIYTGRYARAPTRTVRKVLQVEWTRAGQYRNRGVRLT
jgi:hypothetical protein